MSDILTPRLCVIGTGAGALAIVTAAAALGVPTVLIDDGGNDESRHGAEGAGLAALHAAARVAHSERTAHHFGVHEVEPRTDFAKVHSHIQNVRADLGRNGSPARLTALGIRVVPGPGRFVSPRQFEAGNVQIRARRFVIATGSTPSLPKLPGLETIRPLTSETVFELTALPARLIVLGAQARGLELAQAFRRLGSEVTVLEPDSALAGIDPELAAPVLATLVREGIVLREGVTPTHVEPRHGGIRLFLRGQSLEETLDGSHLLVALGQSPRLEGLGLDSARIDSGPAGIRVDERLLTSNRRVYAIADSAAGHGAADGELHARLVLQSSLFGQLARLRPHMSTRVVLTDPEIAMTGPDEAQARQGRRTVSVLRWPFSEIPQARARRTTEGHIKVVSDMRGRLLGAGIVGPQASELIGLWQLAVQKEFDIEDLAGLVPTHPALSEISRRVVSSTIGARLSRFLRRPG